MSRTYRFADEETETSAEEWGSWGICPFCHRERAMDPRGLLYLHRRQACGVSPATGAPVFYMTRCPGTGQPGQPAQDAG